MCEEITGYNPASGFYIVRDRYKLVSEGAKFEVNYARQMAMGNPKLSGATFTLIKSFDVSGNEIMLKKCVN
jgi:hypothetical protein